MKRAFGALSLSLACVLAPAPAWADEAASWKRRGDEAIDAGRAAEALAAYRRAREIAPSPALEYNIGRALLAVGDFVGALEAFERYDATAPAELKERTHRLAEIMGELRTKIATLTLTGDLEGARVTIRGAPVTTTAGAPLRLNPGAAQVRVVRVGKEPFVANVDLAPGRPLVLPVKLAPERRATGRLALTARPSSARITLDGVLRGVAPVDVELEAGEHEAVITAPSFEPRRLRFTLARGEARRFDIELTPEKKPLTSRWWFWTGVGAVVVAAGAGVAAASLERAPADGSLGTFRVP
jgi:hypothetical protein